MVTASIKKEKEFFSKDPVYSTMDPKYLGTESLIAKLTTTLF